MLRVTTSEVLTELTKSLALVAPVGMAEEDRAQWLAVAIDGVVSLNLSPAAFANAVKRARLDSECDHHAKIVPTIMRLLGDWEPTIHHLVGEPSAEHIQRQADAAHNARTLARIRQRELTQGEIDALPLDLKARAHCECTLSTDYAGVWFYPGTRKREQPQQAAA